MKQTLSKLILSFTRYILTTMAFAPCSSEPVSKEKAIWLSNLFKRCLTAYRADFQRDSTPLQYSSNILERKFRIGTEVYSRRLQGIKVFKIKTDVILSLLDAMYQIRDNVASYCETQDYLDDYGPFSPLYSRFFKLHIVWPTEYHVLFNTDTYLTSFDDFDHLLSVVQQAQLWAVFTMATLHCSALWDGFSPADIRIMLPSVNIGHLIFAQCSYYRVLEEQSALMNNFSQDWDWDLPVQESPYSPAYIPTSPPTETQDEPIIQEEEEEEQDEDNCDSATLADLDERYQAWECFEAVESPDSV